MKTVVAGYGLVCAAALLAGYVSGYALSEVVPVVVFIALFGVAMEFGRSLLLRWPRRSQNDLLRRAGRIFDCRSGPDPADLGWTDRYPMTRISWATMGDTTDDDREPAFALRISCASPVEFAVKNWRISSGPPFRKVKLDAKFAAGEPVNFTTKTIEAFTLWRSREDCRELAQNVVQNGVLQISITGFDITAWWQLESASSWTTFAARLPLTVEMLLQFAHALEGRETSGHGDRKCGRCHADLGRSDAYCSHCGAPWWAEQPAGR